jgi:hypothetical protein
MASLEYLFLNDNKFRGVLPVTGLAAMPRIRAMYLANNDFSDMEAAAAALASALRDSTARPHSVEVNVVGTSTHLYEPSGY